VTWIIGMDGEVLPVSPAEVVDEVAAALERGREAHVGEAPVHAQPLRIVPDEQPPPTRRPSPVAPERFAVLQALLADLLEACGDEPTGELAVSELAARYKLGPDALVDQINLLNLVNFGGGCYAVYVEIDGDRVRVEKELYGEEFRRPARLSPLEAKAILMALDLVGPQVAAGRARRSRRSGARSRRRSAASTSRRRRRRARSTARRTSSRRSTVG
jgi:proteasome accessory factor C